MKKTIAVLLVVLLSGCAQKSLYEWGSYSQDLLVYAKNPQASKDFAEKLRKNLQRAERVGRVPPGMYAEMGYVMVEVGDDREAVTWFEKERAKWPESATLMSGLIRRLSAPLPSSTPVTQ